jgi:hypothetical protein
MNGLNTKNTESKNKTKDQKNIDEKHTDIMNTFFVIENHTIPMLQQEKQRYKKHLKHLEDKKQQNSEEYFDYQDKIEETRKEIRNLRKKKNDYLLNNSRYIFNYYEEKQKISNGENTKNRESMNRFFKIKAKTEESADMNNDRYKSSKKIYQ